MPSILQLLKRRRKKLNLVEKLAGIYKNPGWRGVEDRVLALVQLWADTFMMQEDAYPVYMRAYRELRKEGVKFPARDPNERFMIKFEGEPSPAFELADMEQTTVKPEPRAEVRRSAPSSQQEEEPKLLESDVNALKEGMEVLEEILCNARDVKELQEPRAKDYIRKFRSGQKKLMWVVSYKTEIADEASVIELITIMEFVNEKMENFKKAAGVLKRGGSNNEIRDILKAKKKKAEPVDLLDLGDDFLEINDSNPLDGLDKFIYGRESLRPVPKDVIRNEEVKIQKKEEIVEEKKIEPQRRLEQPDLLIDDFEPTPQPSSNIFDLNTLQIGPPIVENQYGVFNQYPQPHVKANPSRDDFEDFFSDLANRRAY